MHFEDRGHSFFAIWTDPKPANNGVATRDVGLTHMKVLKEISS